MKKAKFCVAALCSVFSFQVAMGLPAGSDVAADETSASVADSLLNLYEQSSVKQKIALAPQLFAICLEGDEVVPSLPALRPDSPADSVDLLVFFAADRYYYNTSDFKHALSYNDRALQLCKKGRDDLRATMLADRAYLLYKQGNMEAAVEAAQEAVQYTRETDNLLQLSRAYLYLSIINMGMRQPNQAVEFVEKAIETNSRLGLNNNTHNAYGIACEVYGFARQPEKAIEYGQKAVEAARQVKSDAGVANHLMQLSYAYNRNGDYEQGVDAAQQAIDFAESMSPPNRDLLATGLAYKAHNLLDMEHYPDAADAIRRAITIEEGLGNVRAVCYDYKTLYEALSHYDEHAALAALLRFATMNDSLHMIDLHEALSKANAEFKNAELQQENAERTRLSRAILVTSVIVVLILLAAIGFLFYAMRLKSRSNQALRDLQRARDAFFTNITHELRTPLTLILGMTHKMKTASPADLDNHPSPSLPNPAAPPTPLDIIEREGNHLLMLINQILDLSKVQANIAPPAWRTGNIVAYLNMLLESFQQLANTKGIEVAYAPEKNVVQMDFVPDYIQKITSNLLSNAIKFTPEYGRIYITTRSNGEQLVMTVADTGKGIGRKHLAHIFDPFYQGDSEGSGLGTGVGLSLVKQIVDSIGGTITADCSPGKGSVFTVTMPMRQGDGGYEAITDEQMDSLMAPPLSANEAAGQGDDERTGDSRQRLLVVEDNRDVAYYIGSQLEPHYDIFYANNGEVGLKKAEDLVPDLIITDLMMPEMDGLELCRRVRSSDVVSHVPIIIITAKATDDERIRGIEAGADAYLYKPFSSEELNMRVSKLLEQRRLLREKFSSQLVVPTQLPGGEAVLPGNGLAVSSAQQADARFLGRVADLVYSLMKRGSIDVDTIASELCMSPSQFRRKLNAITGQTPAAYILRIRMSNAQRLLDSHPEWTIGQVAERCGFTDSAHFTNAFKRQFGITPSQYIRRVK